MVGTFLKWPMGSQRVSPTVRIHIPSLSVAEVVLVTDCKVIPANDASTHQQISSAANTTTVVVFIGSRRDYRCPNHVYYECFQNGDYSFSDSYRCVLGRVSCCVCEAWVNYTNRVHEGWERRGAGGHRHICHSWRPLSLDKTLLERRPLPLRQV